MFFNLVSTILAEVAENGSSGEQSSITPPAGTPLDFGSVVSAIIQILTTIAGIAAFVYLVIGGIQWITSGGDSKKTEAAGKQITNALIGLGIVAVSWAVIVLAGKIFKMDPLNIVIPVIK